VTPFLWGFLTGALVVVVVMCAIAWLVARRRAW
jgi:hypothetical protein